MTTVTRTLGALKRRFCELMDTRFDRRYRSLTGLQKLVTMGLTVGSVTLFSDWLFDSGLRGAVALLAMPFGIFALLTTAFAWLNER